MDSVGQLSAEELELLEQMREDLELVEPVAPEEPYDEEAWADPEYEMELEQRQEWLNGLVDRDFADPSSRVVELSPFLAAVYDAGEWRIEDGDGRRDYLSLPLDPRPYTDEKLVEKLKTYILFS